MLTEIIDFFSIELTVLLTAAIPVIELRGAIPVGISLGLSPLHATILSFIGSMIPVPFVLFTIRPILKCLKSTRLFKRLVEILTKRSLEGNARKVQQKYGFWGLILIVAIPLPGTGVWSGSLLAALLDMRIKWAFPAIFIGNMIAAIIMVILSNSVFSVLSG